MSVWAGTLVLKQCLNRARNKSFRINQPLDPDWSPEKAKLDQQELIFCDTYLAEKRDPFIIIRAIFFK
ncbi:MAG: hypothetical protein ACI8Z1_003790, partial [Candidatus Azotimanducaceae bacterium]